MAQVGNNEDRIGGEFMVQDQDHMGGNDSRVTRRGNVRQSEQSQPRLRQHDDHHNSGQQGGETRRKAR